MLLQSELESQRASSASLALAGGDAAAWAAERRRLMKLLKEAIEHSETKEMEHTAHIQNLNTKYEYEILEPQARLDKEEETARKWLE
eukprot:4911425-Lingulodinium_polyedra.AAC.1